MKDSCYYCKYAETFGYNQEIYKKCSIIGCELKSPLHTICDKYEIHDCYKEVKKMDELRKKLNFRNID